MTELIERLRKMATEYRFMAGQWGQYTAEAIQHDVGDEVACCYDAARYGNRALDLEQAAEALEKLTAHTCADALYHGLARQLIGRVLSADALTDPPDTADVGLRLEAIIRERDTLRKAVQP